MIEHLLNALCDIDFDGKDVYVFGAGKVGRLACYLLPRFSCRLVAILDNASTAWGRKILGTPVCSPESIRDCDPERSLILVASMWHREIVAQLRDMGLTPGKNVVVLHPDVLSPPPVTAIDFTHPREVNGVRIGRYTHDVAGFCVEFSPVRSIGSFCSINGTARIATMHPHHFIVTSGIFYVPDDNQLLRGSRFRGTANDLDILDVRLDDGRLLNGPVTIGSDVWIGQYVSILPSVRIGNGAVIGAGAVVTHDIPDYAIAAGVPASVIGFRFSAEQIRVLNKVAWWEWPEDRIIEEKHLLRDPERFFAKYAVR